MVYNWCGPEEMRHANDLDGEVRGRQIRRIRLCFRSAPGVMATLYDFFTNLVCILGS